MPQATVIMPCYNHGRYVKQSVESILCQTLSDLELIVVDDCSKDDSVSILRELARKDSRLKLIVHESNCGASRSRNDGLRAACGDFVGFCDADDIWKPDKLKTQIKLLMDNSSFDATYCNSEIIDHSGTLTGKLFTDLFPLPDMTSGNLFEALCETNFINMQTVLVRRIALGDRILFDESVKWVEDWWQWIRLSRNHLFIYDNRRLSQYRVHLQSSNATQKPWIGRNRWKVCKRNLRMHSDIHLRLQSLLWYQMGVELSLLAWRSHSRKYFCRAVALGLRGGTSYRKLAKMCARFVAESARSLRIGIF